jgi:putative FmdB family regulatory protein
MPIYEYRCSKCGRVFERIQKFSDAPLTVDEECGGPVERLVSAPAFQFKGTGWYVTDYAKGSGNKPKGDGEKKSEGKSDNSTTESKSESKSDSKSDSKSESKSSDSSTKTESKPSSTPKNGS